MKKTAAVSAPAQTTSTTRKLVVLALLSAIAYISCLIIRVPVISFLKYEPKDIFITLGGFLYGPLAALACSVVAALLELPVGETGPVGMLMNILSTAAFACTTSFIYKKRKDIFGASIGLISGVAVMSVTMLLWNYLIAPLYMGVSRADIVPMLSTVFLPFNLLKAGINAGFTLLLYRPFLLVLKAVGYPVSDHFKDKKSSIIIVASIGACLLAACIGIVIILNRS